MASLALSDLFLGVSRIPEPQNRSKNPTHRSLLLPFGKPWGWGELKVDLGNSERFVLEMFGVDNIFFGFSSGKIR